MLPPSKKRAPKFSRSITVFKIYYIDDKSMVNKYEYAGKSWAKHLKLECGYINIPPFCQQL